MDWDKTIIVRVDKNSGPVLSRLWTKFIKFSDIVGDPSYFLTPLADCLCHVSFSRYSPLSLKVVDKPNKCKSFWPQFFQERWPQLFYDGLLAWPAVHRLASVVEFRLLISVSQWSGMQILRRVGENSLPIWSRLWTKVHVVLRQCSRPLAVVNALGRLSTSCFIRKI